MNLRDAQEILKLIRLEILTIIARAVKNFASAQRKIIKDIVHQFSISVLTMSTCSL